MEGAVSGVEVMPFRAVAGVILQEWRDLERQFAETADIDDRQRILADLNRLRLAYQEAIDEAKRANVRGSPPFAG